MEAREQSLRSFGAVVTRLIGAKTFRVRKRETAGGRYANRSNPICSRVLS